MGTSGLPDMYTRGLRAEGVHIRQTTRAHVTTITCSSYIYLHTFQSLSIVNK